MSCSASGAIPPAQISVSLVNATDNEVIRTLPEIEDAGSYDEEQNKLIKVFDLAPSMEDCGQIVVCNIDQGENCLLYTSPSPRDLSTSRMPSSA